MDRCGLLSVHFLLSTSVLTFRLLDDVVPLVVVGHEVGFHVEDLGLEKGSGTLCHWVRIIPYTLCPGTLCPLVYFVPGHFVPGYTLSPGTDYPKYTLSPGTLCPWIHFVPVLSVSQSVYVFPS